MRNLLLFVAIAAAVITGTAFWMFGSETSSPDPFQTDPTVETNQGAPKAADAVSSDIQDIQRRIAEEMPEVADMMRGVAEKGEAQLAVSGRVIDHLGNAVPNAEVALYHRQDLSSMFEGGRNGGPDIRQMFEGFRSGDRGVMRAMRRRFEARPVTEPVRTASDGTFSFEGETFAEAQLWVTARHGDLAPAAVDREWKQDQGDLQLGEIVLHPGVRLTGTVRDDAGAPVEGATVAYEPSRDTGRGNRGGRTRGRGPGGFTRMFGDPSSDMVPEAVTDAQGAFVLGPVPVGSLRLKADAERFLELRTDRIEVVAEVAPEHVEVTLVRAQQLRGIVVDENNEPVANARVRASRSREAGRDGERRGRESRFGGFNPFGGGSNDDSTRTDEKGQFELIEVAPGPARLSINHASFVDQTLDPVDPGPDAFVTVRMQPAPYLAGVIVDARTGEPIEIFGAQARRDRGSGWRGGRGGRGGRGNDDEDPNAVANAAALTSWRAQRLGTSGRTPGRTPKPEAAPGGAFRLDGLENGTYLIDIDAPGYVKTAFGPFTIEDATPEAGLRITVDRGTVLLGRVTDTRNQAVPGASITIEMPEEPTFGEEDNNDNNPFGRMMRGRFGGQSLARTKADGEGYFELTPLRPGTYRLRVTAEGLQDFDEKEFIVAARNEQDAKIQMFRGATVTGTVFGEDLIGTRVEFRAQEGGRRFSTRIDAETGAYELKGLPPGGYFAAAISGGFDGRRAAMARMLAAQQSGTPDIIVGEGAQVRHDLQSGDVDLGIVKGRVIVNGQVAAQGSTVRLEPVNNDTGGEQDGNGFVRRIAGRLLSGRTDENGEYEVRSVPPGLYSLQVQTTGRSSEGGGRGRPFGGGGGTTVHRQEVSVTAGVETMVDVQVQTATLTVQVTWPVGIENARGRILLVPAEAVAEKQPAEWRRVDGSVSITVDQTGVVTQVVPAGNWRYVLQARGWTSEAGDVSTTLGTSATIAVLPIEAPEANGNRGGGQNTGGNRGGQDRGGNRGGQNRGGNRGGRGGGRGGR